MRWQSHFSFRIQALAYQALTVALQLQREKLIDTPEMQMLCDYESIQ